MMLSWEIRMKGLKKYYPWSGRTLLKSPVSSSLI